MATVVQEVLGEQKNSDAMTRSPALSLSAQYDHHYPSRSPITLPSPRRFVRRTSSVSTSSSATPDGASTKLETALAEASFREELVHALLSAHLGGLALQVRFVIAVLHLQRHGTSSKSKRQMAQKIGQVFLDPDSCYKLRFDHTEQDVRIRQPFLHALGFGYSESYVKRIKSDIVSFLSAHPVVVTKLEECPLLF